MFICSVWEGAQQHHYCGFLVVLGSLGSPLLLQCCEKITRFGGGVRCRWTNRQQKQVGRDGEDAIDQRERAVGMGRYDKTKNDENGKPGIREKWGRNEKVERQHVQT